MRWAIRRSAGDVIPDMIVQKSWDLGRISFL